MNQRGLAVVWQILIALILFVFFLIALAFCGGYFTYKAGEFLLGDSPEIKEQMDEDIKKFKKDWKEATEEDRRLQEKRRKEREVQRKEKGSTRIPSQGTVIREFDKERNVIIYRTPKHGE